MSGNTRPLLPNEAQFADALGHDVLAKAEAAGIGPGLLVLLLGRIAGLTLSAAEIDGRERDEALRAMRREAEDMARRADSVRGDVATLLMEGGHA